MLEVAVYVALLVTSPIITFVFVWVGAQLNKRIKSGAAKDSALECLLAAQTGVRSVEQNLRPQLIAAAKQGQLTTSSLQTMLKDAAVKATSDLVSEQAKRTMRANGIPVQGAIEHAVEAQVHLLKTERKEVT